MALSFSGMVNYNDIDYFEKSWNATAKQYELDGSLYQSSVKTLYGCKIRL